MPQNGTSTSLDAANTSSKVLERQQCGGNASGFFQELSCMKMQLAGLGIGCETNFVKSASPRNEALGSACSMAKAQTHTTVTSCSNVPMMSSLFIVSCGL